MAFTARPHAPPSPDNGLGQGIALGMANLAERFSQKREADKLLLANAKAAQAIYKNNPTLQKMLGVSPEEFQGASAQQQVSMMQAGVTHLTLQQANARARREEAAAALAEEEAVNQGKFPAFAKDVSEMGQAPGSVAFDASPEEFERRTAPVNFGSIMGAASRTGYRPQAGTLDDLLRANAAGAAGADRPLAFDEDPVSGNRFARSGNSVLPSGVNPARASSTAEELFDADGTVIGHRVPIGGGRFTFRAAKPPASGELLPVIDPKTKKPIEGLGMDAAGKVHDYRNNMQKLGAEELLGGAPAKGGKAAEEPGMKRYKFNPATGQLDEVK
jgi:hypothetical protein